MRFFKITLNASALVLAPAAAFAGGGFPGAGSFTTWEGWLTGNIAQWWGICLLAGLCGLIWLAHEMGATFAFIFRGILACAILVFALGIYTATFGGGATVVPPTISTKR